MFTSTGIPGSDSLAHLAGLSPEIGEARIADFQRAFSWLSRPDLVSVAAVQGHAVGAGFQLALACDLRVIGDDAQFTMAEVPLGLVPDLGGTRRLVELVGYSRALEICITGRRIGAAEAMSIGLANRCVPVAELGAAVEETARALLASPRNAMIEAKALLLAASLNTQSEQERAERSAQHRLLRELTGRFDG
jgi:enoyl-CoA hydratase/carnithine racemase